MNLKKLLVKVLWDYNLFYLFFARPSYRWEWLISPNLHTRYAHFDVGERVKVFPLAPQVRYSEVHHSELVESSRTIRKKYKKPLRVFTYAVDEEGTHLPGREHASCGHNRGFYVYFFEEITLKEPAREPLDIPIILNLDWHKEGECNCRLRRLKKFVKNKIKVEGGGIWLK